MSTAGFFWVSLADSFDYVVVFKVKLVWTHQIRRGFSADGDEEPKQI